MNPRIVSKHKKVRKPLCFLTFSAFWKACFGSLPATLISFPNRRGGSLPPLPLVSVDSFKKAAYVGEKQASACLSASKKACFRRDSGFLVAEDAPFHSPICLKKRLKAMLARDAVAPRRQWAVAGKKVFCVQPSFMAAKAKHTLSGSRLKKLPSRPAAFSGCESKTRHVAAFSKTEATACAKHRRDRKRRRATRQPPRAMRVLRGGRPFAAWFMDFLPPPEQPPPEERPLPAAP